MAEPEIQEEKEPVLSEAEGHPHWGERLTREDVLRLIQENGASPEGLDLSGAILRDIGPDGQEKGIDLQRQDLGGIILRIADLFRANLQGAILKDADLTKAVLEQSHLRGVDLAGVKGLGTISLVNIDWGDYKLSQEIYDGFSDAQRIYLILQGFHTRAGLRDTAAEFYYREMECRRKDTSFPQDWRGWLWLNLLWGPLGYGERPGRVVSAGLVVWLIFAAVYFAAGTFWGLTTPDIRHALYISAVSFTAVGYGPWVDQKSVQDWVQGVAAFESFVGVFMIAVFVTTFVRKMTR